MNLTFTIIITNRCTHFSHMLDLALGARHYRHLGLTYRKRLGFSGGLLELVLLVLLSFMALRGNTGCCYIHDDFYMASKLPESGLTTYA